MTEPGSTQTKWQTAVAIGQDVGMGWGRKNISLMAASISFYSMMSLAPLLSFVIWMGSFFFAESTMESQILGRVEEVLGAETASMIADLIQASADRTSTNTIFPIIGILVTIYFASTVFRIIKLTMNIIWDVTPQDVPRTGIIAVLWDRLLSFLMVVLIGGAMVVLMLSQVIVSLMGDFLLTYVPQIEPYLAYTGFGTTLLVVALLTTIAFKLLPDRPLRWRDVLPGALMAAVLFYLGNQLIGIYFSFSRLPVIYGAAGSLVVVLLWVYYTALIFLLSALFSQVIARRLLGFGANAQVGT